MLVLAIVIVVGFLFYISLQIQNQPIEFVYQATAEETPAPSPTPGNVFVDVEGAVHNPGVYELSAAARVEDAINAAGGLRDDAVPERLSMSRAARLRDEQRIYIPSASDVEQQGAVAQVGESTPPAALVNEGSTGNTGESPNAGGFVNINTASKDALMELKGIGEKTAEKIITRRETKGSFTDLSQLVDEDLMYESTFTNLKEQLTL